MNTGKATGLMLAGLLVIAGCANMGGAPVRFSGGVLVNSAGMTLYTFDQDPAGSGKSMCIDNCAAIWPPLKATAEDKPHGDYTIILRADGSRQWAHKGKPLYLWSKDQKPGDKTGDGFNNIWHVVQEGMWPMQSGY
ncbi:MAG: COG4315 family predicted lipoprotein [Burkholderiales bacterium]